jgi:putative ABC transport system permease protein
MWIRDVQYVLRQLRRASAFTVTVVATIGLAMTANALVFTIVHAALLRQLPYQNERQLLVAAPLAPAVVLDWRSRATSFASLSAFLVWDFDMIGFERPERVSVAVVTPNFFVTLDAKARVGRVFTIDDAGAGARVAVLSEAYARRHFDTESNALGKIIRLDDRSCEVVGVMPAAVRFPTTVDVWMPTRQKVPEYPLDPHADMTTNHGSHYLGVIARLAAGTTVGSAQAEQRTIFRQLVSEYPDQMVPEDANVELVPIRRWIVGDLAGQLRILLGIVAIVLLIACANIVGLLIARSSTRAGEVATRTALGATSVHIARPIVIETVVLAVAGGAMGLLVARWALPGVLAMTPNHLEDVAPTLDVATTAFTLVSSIGAGLLVAMAPAFYAVSTSRRPVGGDRRIAGSSQFVTVGRQVLVAAQCAATVTLLVLAVLLLRSFEALRQVDPGFHAQGVYTARIVLPTERYASRAAQAEFFKRLIDRLSLGVGAGHVAAAARLPFVDGDSIRGLILDHSMPGTVPEAGVRVISSDYFHVLQQPVRQGRAFSEHDTATALPVAVVNETFERRYWSGETAVGHRFRVASGGPWLNVVGVVADVKHTSLREESAPEFYLSYEQQPWSFMTVVVRSDQELAAIVRATNAAISFADPMVPVPAVRPMHDLIADSMASEAFETVGLSVFAGMGLLLAAVGLYGVLTYAVSQRRAEFAVRLALGATPRDLAALVLAEGGRIVAGGTACGTLIAVFAARTVRAWLFGVQASDPVTFVLVILTVWLVALAATCQPALGAIRTDPVRALKGE